MKIAIIGLGPSGSNILKNIIDHEKFTGDYEIHLFETREPSKGLPYERDTGSKMLNIKADKMSLNPKDKYHFLNWLEENKIDLKFEEVPSRNTYGNYLNDFFSPYINHRQVSLHKTRVIDLSINFKDSKEIYNLRTEDSKEFKGFDAVFLCLGHPNYNDFYSLKGKDGYIHNPYRLVDKLGPINEKTRVGIIGAGASAIDLFRYFNNEKNLSHSLKMFVRSSAFKLPKIEYEGEQIIPSIDENWILDKLDTNGNFSLGLFIDTIKEDFKKKNIDFNYIYNNYRSETIDHQRKLLEKKDQDFAYIVEYFEILTPLYPYLYGDLSASDQKFFKDNYDEKLELFRTLTPPKTVEWIIEEIEENKLEIIYDLDKIYKKDKNFIVETKDRSYKLDILVNATGFDFRLENSFEDNLLIKNLVKKRIIQAKEDGKYIDVIWPTCNINSPEIGKLQNLYALGMWIGADHYRPNDMRSVLAVTEKVARVFMEK